MWSKLKIDESKSLQENHIFWFATVIPIAIALWFSCPLMTNLQFDLSKNGYDYFLNCFKFPFWIASSSIVLGVIIGRFHGSAQRAATLNATRVQNNFSNYLNHRDHFQKYMQTVADEFDIKVDAFKIYGIIFSESTPDSVNIKLSDGVSDYITTKFNDDFWGKMKFAAPNYQAREVNIYFPRFAREIGINAEKIELTNYSSLKETLIKIRKIYSRAMEYGFTRSNLPSDIESEESGISTLIGEFDEWSNLNSFKKSWS
jgi:hypothetical protein